MDAAPRLTGLSRGERPCVVGLGELDAGGLPLAGGKAANLGELIRAGLPVPEGFCVTTDAYSELAHAADLAGIVNRPVAPA